MCVSFAPPMPYFVIGDSVKHLSDLRGVLSWAGYGPGGVERVTGNRCKIGVQQILLLSRAQHRGVTPLSLGWAI